jgi:hypothetical protein
MLDGGFSVVVSDDRGFEGLVILGILEHGNDRLRREATADGAFRGDWAGALERIASWQNAFWDT